MVTDQLRCARHINQVQRVDPFGFCVKPNNHKKIFLRPLRKIKHRFSTGGIKELFSNVLGMIMVLQYCVFKRTLFITNTP